MSARLELSKQLVLGIEEKLAGPPQPPTPDPNSGKGSISCSLKNPNNRNADVQTLLQLRFFGLPDFLELAATWMACRAHEMSSGAISSTSGGTS